MRMNWMLATAAVAMSVTAAAAASVTAVVDAQSAKAMAKPAKGETMEMTYTGCVVSVDHGGEFLLTKVDSVGAQAMPGAMAMHQHDGMAMKDDTARAMPHEQAPMTDDKMDTMPSKSFFLVGANLSKHAGQKVSVTGSLADGSKQTMRQDVSTLTVRTLKVIAKSCS